MSQDIAKQVVDIVAKHVDADRGTLTPDSTLKDLGVDSLETIETFFDLEEHFDINFPDRDPNLDNGTIGGLIAVVEQLVREKAAASTGSTAAIVAAAH